MNKKVLVTIIILIIISIIFFTLTYDYYQPSEYTSTSLSTTTTQTPKNFKVAFIGDQAVNKNAKAVLQLIKDEKADMVLHQGDFDYLDNPEIWDKQINDILGPSFPYFASIGNHDLKAWSGYRQKLIERFDLIDGEKCSGDIGVNSSCTYQGIFFVLSGVGTLGEGHEAYLQQELAKSNSIWKICSWHKNQTLMQLGGKFNDVGWQAYDICRQYGAIIATGHEHSYSRTYLMNNFATQTIASTSDILEITNGQTFAFVNGLAGHSIRDTENKLDQNPWWASTYTSDNNANYGALFCQFNYEGQENKANCYFKDVDGNIPDQFMIISQS